MILERIKYVMMKNQFLKSFFQPMYRLAMKPGVLKQNYLFKRYGLEAIQKLNNVFEKENIEYWLEFGTLLGAVREKNFIEHDLDIDIGLFIDNDSDKIEQLLTMAGFKKIQQIEVDNGSFALEQTYQYRGVTVDLFYFTKIDNMMYCHVFTGEYGKSWESTIEDNGGLVVYQHAFPYKGLKKIKFLKMNFTIPSNEIEHLTAQYGNDFMVKDKNWNPYVMAPNKTILIDKKGIVK